MVYKGKKGVSPVIGSILMITIIVILAGVAIVYMSEHRPTGVAPLATLDVKLDVEENQLVVEHQNGQDLAVKDLALTIDGKTVQANWNVEILTFGENANVSFSAGYQLEPGCLVAIVHEPTGEIIYKDWPEVM